MNKEFANLIEKHQKPLPRYTSYPPVGKWNQAINKDLWFEEISQTSDKMGLDLYIHIPYCESLCYYCGCNRVISKNKDIITPYVQSLIKEFKLYEKELGKELKIHSIHFGGGTPNFLAPEQLNYLLTFFTSKKLGKKLDIAIELDPRTLDPKHIQVLKRFKTRKVSFGIQDFDLNVQEAINRIQPFNLVTKVVDDLRAEIPNIEINFDLIYGLPRQKIETVKKTLRLVSKLKPDTIAFYSYAHLPARLKNQRLIKTNELKAGLDKLELFKQGRTYLLENGYMALGLDHFAKVGSSLDRAKQEKKLTRNFMGHTVSKSHVILGLGASSISSGKTFIFQNESDIKKYKEYIEKEELFYKSTHIKTDHDNIISNLINQIMCDQVLHLNDIIQLENNLYFQDLIQDKVLELKGSEYKVTEQGIYFLRNIASCFDQYLGENKEKAYSSSI